jgi:hypothetical protein
MTRILLTLLLSLAILVGFGAAVSDAASISGMKNPTPQMAVIAVVFNALATLMNPISSASGGGTYMPIGGEVLYLGFWPIIAWILAGLGIGLMAGEARATIPAALTSSALTYILWIMTSIMVLPAVQSTTPWELYLAQATGHLLLQAPLDFLAILTLPAVSSITLALFEPIPSAGRPAAPPPQPVRRRFWEYEE